MEKLKMKSQDVALGNVAKIAALFPHCVTEHLDKDGKQQLAIDFDKLRDELSTELIGDTEERYQFTWPDKRAASRKANEATDMTLRPDIESSVDFWNTKNLYIEGDNLDVLKVLRENYLGAVKMIYIDPPYNTGNDFVYNDDYAQSREEFETTSGLFDENGNQTVDPMQRNTESNGRFHTDWLNMIYPRLKVARDLLSEDGVIFISIDDNETKNLKSICDEIFGESNYFGQVTWSKKRKGSFLSKGIISLTEYLHVYAKNRNKNIGLFGGKADENESQPIIKRTNRVSILDIPANLIVTKLPDGTYPAGTYGDDVNPVTLLNDVIVENGLIVCNFKIQAPFTWSQANFNEQVKLGARFVINTMNFQIRVFKIQDELSFKGFPSLINGVDLSATNEDAYEELNSIFGIKKLFDYSKPKNYIKELAIAATNYDKNALILDFFSGSATTAHAVMQLNAEDGGNRKFIMVQLPEKTEDKSEARKAGYENICQIGEERIRRAGKKIKEEFGDKAKDLDTGFRVLKLDYSNMQEVYYTPEEYDKLDLFSFVDNVKEDRTDLDLLFQVMPELDIELSAHIDEKSVNGKKVFFVDDTFLVATFDKDVNESCITEIAKMQPQYFVMRDASAANDNVLDNFEQIFRHYSPDTIRKIL